MIDRTCTCAPPICLATSPQTFSAATTLTTRVPEREVAELLLHAAAALAAATTRTSVITAEGGTLRIAAIENDSHSLTQRGCGRRAEISTPPRGATGRGCFRAT